VLDHAKRTYGYVPDNLHVTCHRGVTHPRGCARRCHPRCRKTEARPSGIMKNVAAAPRGGRGPPKLTWPCYGLTAPPFNACVKQHWHYPLR